MAKKFKRILISEKEIRPGQWQYSYKRVLAGDNSEMIEKVKETKREELFDTIVEEVMGIASMEMLGKVEEKITDLVEDFIEEKPSSDELKKMKKAELLSLAKRLEIEGITSRTTKKQIIEAIEEKRLACF